MTSWRPGRQDGPPSPALLRLPPAAGHHARRDGAAARPAGL